MEKLCALGGLSRILGSFKFAVQGLGMEACLLGLFRVYHSVLWLKMQGLLNRNSDSSETNNSKTSSTNQYSDSWCKMRRLCFEPRAWNVRLAVKASAC